MKRDTNMQMWLILVSKVCNTKQATDEFAECFSLNKFKFKVITYFCPTFSCSHLPPVELFWPHTSTDWRDRPSKSRNFIFLLLFEANLMWFYVKCWYPYFVHQHILCPGSWGHYLSKIIDISWQSFHYSLAILSLFRCQQCYQVYRPEGHFKMYL